MSKFLEKFNEIKIKQFLKGKIFLLLKITYIFFFIYILFELTRFGMDGFSKYLIGSFIFIPTSLKSLFSLLTFNLLPILYGKELFKSNSKNLLILTILQISLSLIVLFDLKLIFFIIPLFIVLNFSLIKNSVLYFTIYSVLILISSSEILKEKLGLNLSHSEDLIGIGLGISVINLILILSKFFFKEKFENGKNIYYFVILFWFLTLIFIEYF